MRRASSQHTTTPLTVRRLEKSHASAAELCFAVRACPAKTDLGRARAFVRFALMTARVVCWDDPVDANQKCLADQFRAVL